MYNAFNFANKCRKGVTAETPADRTTVYPSRAGGFPPASFLTFAGAFDYIRTLQGYCLTCGICTCPAGSYAMHYRDTCL